MTRPLTAALAVALALSPALPAAAQDPALRLELNAAETVAGACRLTFLVENALGADLTALSFETVVLTTEGKVAQLTLLDFREVPAGRMRVRQFDLAQQDCAGIGRILINGAAACEGAPAADACIRALKLDSRTGLQLVG